MANNIQYNIGLKYNSSGLATVKKELTEMQSLITAAETKEFNAGKIYPDQKVMKNVLSNLQSIGATDYFNSASLTRYNNLLKQQGSTFETVKTSMASYGNIAASTYNGINQATLQTNMQLTQQSKLLDGIFTTFGKTVRWGLSASVFNTMQSAIQKAYYYSLDLDRSLNDIRIVTGQSADNMKDFAKEANSAAHNLGASTTDFTDAALIYYQQGDSDAVAKAKAEITVKTANVTGQTGAEVSEQLTAVWNGYQVSAAESELYIDKLAAVAASTASDLEELSTGMAKVASAANLMGVDVDQLNATLATVVSVTRQAPETVGTAFKTIYARMGDIEAGLDDEVTLGSYTEQMAEMGVNVLNAQGELREMGEVIEEVGGKWTTMSTEQQIALSQIMAGTRQYNNLLSLFDNWDMYENALSTSQNAMGTLEEQNNIYLDSIDAKLQKVETSAQAFYDVLFNEDEYSGFLSFLDQAIQSITSLTTATGGGIKTFAAFGANLASVFSSQVADSVNRTIANKAITEQNQEAARIQYEQSQKAPALMNYNQNVTNGQFITQEIAKGTYETNKKSFELMSKLNKEQADIVNKTREQVTENEKRLATEKAQTLELAKQLGVLKEVLVVNEETGALRTANDFERFDRSQLELNERVIDSQNNDIKGIGLMSGEDALYSYQATLETMENLIAAEELIASSLEGQKDIENQILAIKKEKTKLTAEDKAVVEAAKEMQEYIKEKEKILSDADKTSAKSFIQTTKDKYNLDESFKIKPPDTSELKSELKNVQNTTKTLETVAEKTKKAIDEQMKQIVKTSASGSEKFKKAMTEVKNAYKEAQKEFDETGTYSISALTNVQTKIDTATKTKQEDVDVVFDKVADIEIMKQANEENKKYFDTVLKTVEAEEFRKQKIQATLGALSLFSALMNGLSSLDTIWSDDELSGIDKFSQTVMSLGMTIPFLVQSIQSLSVSYKALKAEKISVIAQQEIERMQSVNQILQTDLETQRKEALAIANKKVAISSAAMATATIGAMVAISVLIVVLQKLEKARVAALEAQIDAIDATKEELAEEKEQLNTTKELQDTYLDLAKAYEQGTASIEELDAAANALNDTNQTAAIRVASLTNNYAELTEQVKAYNKEVNEQIISNAEEDMELTKKANTLQLEIDKVRTTGIELTDSWQGSATKKAGTALAGVAGMAVAGPLGSAAGAIAADKYFEEQEQAYNNMMENIFQDNYELGNLTFDIDTASYDEAQKFVNQLYDAASESTGVAKENLTAYANSLKELLPTLKEYEETVTAAQIDIEIKEIDWNVVGDDYSKVLQDYVDFLQTLPAYANVNEIDLTNIAVGQLFGADSGMDDYLDSYSAAMVMFNNRYNQGSLLTTEQEFQELFDSASKAGQKDTAINDKMKFILDAAGVSDYTDMTTYAEALELYNQRIEEQSSYYLEFQNMVLDGLADTFDREELLAAASMENFSIAVQNKVKDMTDSGEIAQAYQDLLESMDLSVALQFTVTEDVLLDLDDLGMEEDAFLRYADYLGSLEENGDKAASAITDMAIAQLKFNKGWQTLADNWDDWTESITDAKARKDAQSYFTAISEIGAALEDMFGAAPSTKFIEDKFEKIEEMANGSEDAVNDLRQSLIHDFINESMDIIPDGEIYKDINSVKNKLNEIFDKDYAIDFDILGQVQDQFGSLETYLKQSEESFNALALLGKEKLSEEQLALAQSTQAYVDNINEMLNAGIIAKEQVAQLMAMQGLSPEWEMVDVTQRSAQTQYSAGYTMTDGGAPVKTVGVLTTVTDTVSEVPQLKGATSIGTGSTGGFKPTTTTPSSSSSGSTSEPKQEDSIEDEKDVYHDIDIILKQISNDLDKIQSQTDKLFGSKLIQNYQEQYALLAKNVDAYAEKIKIAQSEAARLQAELSGSGVTFNSDGTIANYAAAYDAQLAIVNSVIDKYNAMSADGQDAYQDTLDAAKEAFEEFVDKMSEYDDTVTDLIPSLEQDIIDALDEQIELQIEAFHMEIEIRLDMKEAEQDWADFYARIMEGITDEDILGNALTSLEKLDSYYQDNGSGIIQQNAEHLQEIMDELYKLENGEKSDIYSMEGTEDNIAQALEDLQTYYEESMSLLEEQLDLVEEIYDYQLDMLDETNEKLTEQLDTYETIRDLIQNDMDIVTLLNGEEDYITLQKFYEMQEENNNKQLEFNKLQVDFWAQQMSSLEEGSEAWYAAKDNWLDAVGGWNDAITTSIENLQDKYLNTIQAIFQELNDQVTSGAGLSYLEEEWGLMDQYASNYLDTINSIYEVQSLENKYQTSIDEMTNTSSQAKLNALMEEELALLREKDQLTQYDIDRANLKYEIALKQIALEEAQQNKSTMRLKRDSQGNYSYAYAADDDEVNSLQQELSDLYNELYNLDSSQYQASLNELYTVWAEFQQKMAEAAEINDPEERAAYELLITEYYGELINALTADNETLKNNLYQSSMSHLFDLYNQNEANYDMMTEEQKAILDQFLTDEVDLTNAAFNNLFGIYDSNIAAFENMTDEQKNILMGSMVPQWNSAIQQMADKIAGEGGFEEVCKEAFEKIEEATQDYADSLDDLEESAGVNFDNIQDGLNDTITSTDDLLESNQDLIATYEDLNKQMAEMVALAKANADARQEEVQAYKDLTEAAYNYWLEQQRQAAADAEELNDDGGLSGTTSSSTSSSSSSSSSSSTTSSTAPSLSIGSAIQVKSGTKWYYDSYGNGPSGTAKDGSIKYTSSNAYGYNIDGLGWIKKTDIEGYKTGGYTGEWDNGSQEDSGRIAMLHQKEMVLNESDTANMLQAIDILRGLVDQLGSSALNQLANLGNVSVPTATVAENKTLEQNVQIQADFPNVKDASEIEEALNNLVNKASQTIY